VTAVAVAAPARTRLEKLVGALPILTVFFWLCLVYSVESWGHLTPWLFTDELELTQLSRAVAETGHAARRGDPHSFNTLYTFLLAPAWRIASTETAYSAVKYIGVATMTSVLFPAYWLARMVVSSRPALFAATAAAAIPALLYASMLVEEPLAYPYATLGLFLIAKGLATRGQLWLSLAFLVSLGGPLVRGELGVLPVVYLLAVLFLVWTSARARRWRATWSRWDWIGGLTLIAGAVIVVNAFVSHHAYSWLIATTFYKGRMIDNGLWAAGALTIGLGVLPVVAGLASLVRPRDELRTAAEKAFTAVFVSALIAFGWYTAVKAAYISTVFSTLVVERNLVYLAPLLFTGTAIFLERRRLRLVAVVPAAAFALYLILTTPYKMEFHLYSDAPGLAILEAMNRNLGLTPHGARVLLILIVAGSVAVCVLPSLVRGRELVVRSVLVCAALLVLAWNVTGQIAAASASNSFSSDLLANFPKPVNWVDRATGGKPAFYLGQRITDPNGIWLLEFWNRSLVRVWSLDGTAPGPGRTVTPDVIGRHGELTKSGFDYVVVDEGINLVGKVIATQTHRSGGTEKLWRLYRLQLPLRLRQASTGIYDDGWTGRDSAYSQFSTPGKRLGYAVVTISRKAWGGPNVPGHVLIRVGTLRLDQHHQPAMGRVTSVVRWVVNSHGYKQFYIRAPAAPFRVEVRISPTFVPAKLDPNSTETREFGAQVNFGFTEKLPKK
jgi:hypothetical protein